MNLQGYPVLEIVPQFADPPTIAGRYQASLADLSDAPRANFMVGRKPIHVLSQKYLFQSRAEAEAFEDFFDEVAGTWGTFWVPSWHGELNPTVNADSGATELSISPVNYATVFDPTTDKLNDLGHFIWFLHYDGTFEIKRVTAVTGTDPEVLTLDSGLSRQYKVGEFLVGFLYLVRFMNDELSLNFTGLNHIDCDSAMIETPEVEFAVAVPDICTLGPGDLINNVYQYQGYFDGLIAVTGSSSGAPTFDGKFRGKLGDGFWLSGEPQAYSIQGNDPWLVGIVFDGCIDSVPQWRTFVGCPDNDGKIWQALKVGGDTPEGVYIRDAANSVDGTPASITVELTTGTTVTVVGSTNCTN